MESRMSLKQQQKLIQKLSPQQIQVLKLIQIPAIALEERIKEEIENNPALEEVGDSWDEDEESFKDSDEEENAYQEANENELDEATINDDYQKDDIDLSAYFEEDEYIPAYKLKANNYSNDDEERQIPFRDESNFYHLLYEQLHTQDLSEEEMLIGEYIIGSIDDNGYLKRDARSIAMDLSFYYNIAVSPEQVEKVISIIQSFDPPGIAARDLRECLLLQLRRIPEKNSSIQLAIRILDEYFEEFTKKHFDKIQRKLGITEEELKKALQVITKLNPKPGNSTSEGKGSQAIFPDFIVYNDDGKLQVVVNTKNIPELRINKYYQTLYETFRKQKKHHPQTQEVIQFIKQKLDAAKFFIDALKQRNDTLQTVIEAIVDYQKEFFLTGDESKIKPMILKDIAEKTNLDISTISRVASSKYVQTPYGTFLLKKLFSESLENTEGEEVSTIEVKSVLKKLIEEEDKKNPLTDEELVELLKQKGYPIARRTVAKYREQLGIPVARLRKEI